jgi:magnesium transporter
MTIKERNLLVEELIASEKVMELLPVLKKMPAVEVGEVLDKLENKDLLEILPHFSEEQQGHILSEFDVSRQIELFEMGDKKWFSQAFENMYSESRADFYQKLEPDQQLELLPYLSKPVREDVLKLSSYPPETAGGIMSTDFATVLSYMTCEQAIAKVRWDSPSKKMVYYIYVVDEDMKMQGFITLKDLIMKPPQARVGDFVKSEYVFAWVDEDREEVAKKIERYDLVAIPVLNRLSQLVGIVTHDEAIEIIRAEHTEDLEKFMGIVHRQDEVDYIEASPWQHFTKRVIWLSALAIIGLMTGLIIEQFEDILSKLIILVLYMPMIAQTGGNAGSQAATVVIRALALGQITSKDWLRVVWKETRIAIMLSVILTIIAFLKIMLLSRGADVPEGMSLIKISLVICFALSLQVISATLIGAGLPLAIKRFGGDPAVAASPAITTLVDVTGLLLYFTSAVIFLQI